MIEEATCVGALAGKWALAVPHCPHLVDTVFISTLHSSSAMKQLLLLLLIKGTFHLLAK